MAARPAVRSYPNRAAMPAASPDGSIAFSVADGLFAEKISGTWTLISPATSPPAPATAVPLVDAGSGAVGTSVKYAREDHVHPSSGGGLTGGKISVNITLAELQALGAGVNSFTKAFPDQLPVGARLVGITAKLVGAAYTSSAGALDQLTITAIACDGLTDSAAALLSSTLSMDATTADNEEGNTPGTAGALDQIAGETVSVSNLRILTPGFHTPIDLNTLTDGGTLTVTLYYVVIA